MSSSQLAPAPRSALLTGSSLWNRWLPLALFAVLWLDLCRLLSTQWAAREQYAYGWFVPFFAAALLWRRWLDRPLPSSRSPTSTTSHLSSATSDLPSAQVNRLSSRGHGVPFLLSAFCFLLCLLLLPLRVIFEINTDWPLITWLYTAIVVVLTLYAFHLADPTLSPLTSGLRPPPSGRSLTFLSLWLRHFAFPVAFILVAVIWPYRIEKGLTQGLMRIVTNLTVEILGWLDIPALQRGNLIELSYGTLGIDEACSGIRSFQSSVMAGLLMGELYRLRLLPRGCLLVAGAGTAFCLNVVRTLLLSFQANREGATAVAKWHDPAGFTITVACFFALWALAVVITRWSARRGQPAGHGLLATGRAPFVTPQAACSSGSAFHLCPEALTAPPASGPPGIGGPWCLVADTRAFMLACGLWSLLCIAATEAWYRSHADPHSGNFHWSVAMPEAKPTYQEIKLPPRSVQLLAFDEGISGEWSDENGWQWSAHFFRWKPRSVKAAIYARVHRPEVCLPASGFSQVAESKLVYFNAGRFELPFRKYTYQRQGQVLHVFFCQWEDGPERQSGVAPSGKTERLRAVWVGRRHVGQQTLEIIVTGAPSLEEAEARVRLQLPSLVQPSSQPGARPLNPGARP